MERGAVLTPIAAELRRIGDAVLAVAWAPSCAACEMPLESPTRSVVCPACWQAVALNRPPVCAGCGTPLPPAGITVTPAARCAGCLAGAGPRTPRRAAGPYDGRLRAIIHAFKYQGRRSLAPRLTALMRAAGADLLEDADLVVPVPLHAFRHWRRGFNQAGDLAEHLGPPVAHALRRTRHTRPQVGLSGAARRRSVDDAFALVRPFPLAWKHTADRVRGRVVVLADDVATTGATIEACAQVLQQAGARQVSALTVAQAATRPPTRAPRRSPSSSAPRRHAATGDARPAAHSSA